MVIRNNYTCRPKATADPLEPGSEVEKAGYIPIKRQIEEMTIAGNRLNLARKEQYDTFDGTEPAIDPTRGPGYDIADASMTMNEYTRRVREARKKRDDDELKKRTDKDKSGETPPLPPAAPLEPK